MISGIQQCVGKFDIKNKDLIEYLRTSIYHIKGVCWLQAGPTLQLTTSICRFSSQLFHAVHVCVSCLQLERPEVG